MPTLLARGLPLHTARRRLLTAGPGAPAKPLTFLACAGHTASWAQPRCWALPAQGQGLPWGPPTHQLPQSFCSTVPGGKKLPPDSQGQEAGSKQTPPGITEGRTGADGTQRLLAPAMSPRPCGCLPRPSAAPPSDSDPTHHAAESPRGRSSPPHRRQPGSATLAQDHGHDRWGDTRGHRPRTPGPLHTAELGREERGLSHCGARAPGCNGSKKTSPR